MTFEAEKCVDYALRQVGFSCLPTVPKLYLVNWDSDVSPAYYATPIRRRGKVQLGGGVGIYFREFEEQWNSAASRADLKTEFTLPLIMLIDNYLLLIRRGVFEFTNQADEVIEHASEIFGLCSSLPCSIEDFVQSLTLGKIGGKRISDYLHIFAYHENDDEFLRKSVGFVHWFINKWPQHAEALRKCLTQEQLMRI